MKARFDGALRDPEHAGDLGNGAVLAEAERQQDLLVAVEPAERGPDLVPLRESGEGVGCPACGRVQPRAHVADGGPRLAAEPVAAGVHQDPAEPGAGRGGVAEVLPAPPREHEGVVDGILSGRAVPKNERRCSIRGVDAVLGEGRKSPGIAEVTDPDSGLVVPCLDAHLQRHMSLTPDEG